MYQLLTPNLEFATEFAIIPFHRHVDGERRAKTIALLCKYLSLLGGVIPDRSRVLGSMIASAIGLFQT